MAKVKIQGHASGTGVLTVTAPNTSTDRTITLPDSTGTLVDSTTAVTKDANGNVGIGVTPETDWNNSFKAVQLGDGASIYGGVGWRETQISTNARATLGSALNGYKYIATDKTSTYQQYDGNHNFRVAASGSADAAITWTTGFEVLNDGKARAKNGLLFGTDTAAANALDDYEEGTWTPSLGANSGRSGTWSSTLGIYTKIGNIVHLYIGITGSAMYFTSELGYQNITGLPFTAANPTGLSNYSGSWSGDAVTRSSGGHLYLHTTNIYMHARNESPATSGVSGFGCYISYRTND